MEEILASIRRIIADDQDGGRAVAPGAEPPHASLDEPTSDHDVVDLAELKPTRPTHRARELEHEDVSVREAEEPLTEPRAAEDEFDDEPAATTSPPPPRRTPPPPESLLSAVAQTTAAQAFQKLSTTVLSSNPRTLEDVVTEMMRPMLKAWLDENLPPLVERLVRAEIERVARGGR